MILKMETVMLAKKVHLTLIYVQQNTYKTLLQSLILKNILDLKHYLEVLKLDMLP